MARKPHRQHDGANEQKIPGSDIVRWRAWDGLLFAVCGSARVTQRQLKRPFLQENVAVNVLL